MKWEAWRDRLARFPESILLLAMRIGVGAVFFRSGLLKIGSWEFTIRLFRDEYRVPLLDPVTAAHLATSVELAAPPLLFAGLATRAATLPLLGMIAVIQVLVYPNAWSDHLMWSAALLLILTRGGGAISLDHWIAVVARRLLRRGRADAAAVKSNLRTAGPC